METKKVRCINNKGEERYLTINKVYDLCMLKDKLYILDDNKDLFRYTCKYFTPELPNNTNSTLEVNDNINPTHYSKLAIQPIEFITKNKLAYNEGNVIKYICRYKEKNGVEDLKKAKQYIDFLIDEYEPKSDR